MERIRSASVVAESLVYQIGANRLVDGVNLRGSVGDFIGIIGPNGAGKTTLLRLISGLVRQQAGVVSLAGQNLNSLSPKAISRIAAYVPQILPYTFGFTSLEVVLMGRYPHMGWFQIEGMADHQIAMEAMRRTETLEFSDRSLMTLSGGERQRVFLARALAQKSQILLMDEPTSNLDIQHQLGVMDMLSEFATQGMTVIMAIHDINLAARYCGRLLLMDRGQVLADGKPEAVLTASNLQNVFGVKAVVYTDPLTGAPAPIFIGGRLPMDPIAECGGVHLVCGDGTGARTMAALWGAGIPITAGPLQAGDFDRIVADSLGIVYLPMTAPGSVGSEIHLRHLELVESAKCVVLCNPDIRLKDPNSREVVASAKRLVHLMDLKLGEQDNTDQVAPKIHKEGEVIVTCRTPTEVVRFIQGNA